MISETISRVKQNVYLSLIERAVKSGLTRNIVLNQIEKKFYDQMVTSQKEDLKAVQVRKYRWVMALIKQTLKNYDKGYISRNVAEKLIEVLGLNNFCAYDVPEIEKARKDFSDKYKREPPLLMLVSPTQVCNLRCKGCYAASSPEKGVTMPFEVLDRILRENHDIFGSRFIAISGGEPLMYKSQGKTILDIIEKYNDTFFLLYTNGTLITKEVAKRLSETGNAVPQISAEGLEKETDERRGKGVFKMVLRAMSNLREVGMPFALSVTPTTKNIDTILSDEFYDFWFEKQGASYMWQFQFMPIGRGKDVFDLMPKPEQRLKLYHNMEKRIEQGYPMADFWNSAVLSNGCIAYGRTGGYFYIDWNGNVMPCVFVPYYVDNVYKIYKRGGTIADALLSKFFKNGRKWQNDYGYIHHRRAKNWLMPCPIRDHHSYFRENILPRNAKGEDKFAEEAKDSKEYYEGFVEYDKSVKKLTLPIWKKEYKE